MSRGRLREFVAFLNTYDEDGYPHASNEAKRRAAELLAADERGGGEGLALDAARALIDEWDAAMAGDMPLNGHYQRQALERLRSALADLDRPALTTTVLTSCECGHAAGGHMPECTQGVCDCREFVRAAAQPASHAAEGER